jgi:hypothetical protein
MTIQKINSSRNTATRSTYVGEKGRLFYDEANGVLYISDGRTAGGISINGGTGYSNGALNYSTILGSKVLAGTVLLLPSSASYTLQDVFSRQYLDVFVDGFKWTKDLEYTETTTTSITPLVSIPSGSTISYRIEK